MKQQGFTLIELLVSMAIMVILIGIASLSVGRGFGDSAYKEESRRLKALIELASEESVMFNKSIGIRFDVNVYKFYQLNKVAIPDPNAPNTNAATATTGQNTAQQSQNPFLPGGGANQSGSAQPQFELLWEEIETDRYFVPRQLPEDFFFNLFLDSLEVNLDIEDFKGETFNQDENKKNIKPHIFFTPDGEMFPDFEVRILMEEEDDIYGITELGEEGEVTSSVYDETVS